MKRLKEFMGRNILLTLFCTWVAVMGTAATLGVITQLPDAGGVFTQLNHDTINTDLTNIGTSFTNINAVIGSAGSSPSGTGNLCLTTNCVIGLANGTGLPLTTGVTGVLPIANGGTNATTFSGVLTQSVVLALTLSQLQTLNSVGVAVLPAPAATSMYMMGPCTLNLTHGSAAFTGGGTVTIGYGSTAATTASNSTIASTVFTTFTASHLVTVEPTAQSVGATTLYAGLGVWMNAAGSDFASGTGGSGQLSCQYSVITGVQ